MLDDNMKCGYCGEWYNYVRNTSGMLMRQSSIKLGVDSIIMIRVIIKGLYSMSNTDPYLLEFKMFIRIVWWRGKRMLLLPYSILTE